MRFVISLLAASMVIATAQAEQAAKPSTEAAKPAIEMIETTSLALRGQPFYKPDFTQFNYVNPDAPLGGDIRSWAMGTFDNFNPYSRRGDPATGSSSLNSDLMGSSDDDLNAVYPLVAEKMVYASDYSQITFHIDPRAVFHDGVKIKPSDIKFSFEKFTSGEALPGLKEYYSFVEKIEVLDENRVTFFLNDKRTKARMMSLCSFTVLPEHFWKDHRLDEPLKEPPVGSGPVKVADYKYGKYVKYETIRDYWGEDLPVLKGLLNEGSIQYDYYRDSTVAFEAFKAGHIDKWNENIAKRWATGYEFPAVKDGRVLKNEVPHQIPLGTQGFIFNTKRPLFSDIRVRKAISYLMDFEWMNKNLFYDQYVRTDSFFTNTDYRATGLPSEAELKLLEPLRGKIPDAVFTEAYKPPVTKGDGNIRSNLRQALRLFKAAGWNIKNQKLINNKTGKQFEFEMLLVSASSEKIALPFRNNLERAGIIMHVRTVDSSQYMNRTIGHDYDMISRSYRANPYPSSGTHQMFHSKSVGSSYNHANLTDPAIDSLLDAALEVQEDEAKLLPIGRALDRVLLHSHILIPQWNISKFRVANWDKFGKPEKSPRYSQGDAAWWIDPVKAADL